MLHAKKRSRIRERTEVQEMRRLVNKTKTIVHRMTWRKFTKWTQLLGYHTS